MSATIADLFHLELQVRQHANLLRDRWPVSMLSDPSVPPDTKIHARTQQTRADEFDLVGDMLEGLQGDWDRLAPQVRAGYVRMEAEKEALKDRGRDSEAAA